MLIDAGRRWDRRRIFAELEGREISMVALTHVHPDHQGCAKAVCEAPACRSPATRTTSTRWRAGGRSAATANPAPSCSPAVEGPPHKVDRVLREGDEVAGFRVVHAPGHARGEVIFFRDSDRVAICGDVIRNISYLTLRTRLAEPPDDLTPDPAENRRSIRKLADLNPSLILPGHGPAVTDIAAFERFAAAPARVARRTDPPRRRVT